MTAAMTPGAAPSRRPASPAVVLVACYLLAGVAALRVVAGICDFYALPEVTRYYSDLHGDGSAGQARGVGLILLAVLSLAVAVVYLLLAILNGLGMTPARIITWIVAGLTIVISGIALPVGGYDGVVWYRRAALGLTVATLVFAGASVVLLALPAAHRYFRARRRPPSPPAQWRPPVYPPPGYPQRPYPPAPPPVRPPGPPPSRPYPPDGPPTSGPRR
jgi:hypothetical protein